MLSMQIIPISQNAISITFSEQGSEDYENFMSGMRDSLGELMEDGNLLTGSSEQEDDEVLDGEDLSKQNIEKKVHVTDTDKITTVMIALDSIDTMAEFCRVLNIDKAVKSQLYRLENKGLYFLIIDKGRISADMMRHILLLAVEYTSNITDEAEAIAYIREYGEMIIEKGAYRILKTYV
jgi:negative regulator of genetic competence, sporulation and motility